MPPSPAPRHAILPGTFDPFTLAHLDLAERAVLIFDRVTVLVASHHAKQHLLDAAERLDLARRSLDGLERVDVDVCEGLLVDACDALGASIIVRGLRTGTDLEYERQMAETNRVLRPNIDTVFLTPGLAHGHVSSTLVRQIASMGGDVAPFVPACVDLALRRRFASERSNR